MYARKEESMEVEMKLEKKIEEYPDLVKSFYKSMLTKSYTTKYNYIHKVIDLLTYLQDVKGKEISDEIIKGITVGDMDDYIIYLIREKNPRKDYSKSYLANQISGLNSFFSYLTRKKIIQENPMDGIDNKPSLPNVDSDSIVYLTSEDKKKVFENIHRGVGSEKGRARQEKYKNRDMLLIMLPLLTGVRVSALVHINMEDIDIEERILTIYDKGFDKIGKPQEKMIPEELVSYIEAWVEDRDQFPEIDQTNALFISNYGGKPKRLTPVAVRKIVSKFTVGLDKHITPHKLRSTFGTDYYRLTHDIYSTAEAMGHSRVDTTKRYAAVDKMERQANLNVLAKNTTNLEK